MSVHITNMCKASFFYLQDIRRIKKFLLSHSLAVLVHALISSRLDYYNTPQYGVSCSEFMFRVHGTSSCSEFMVRVHVPSSCSKFMF